MREARVSIFRTKNRHPWREDVHAIVNCSVNDGLFNAMPNMQKTLLQFSSSAIYKEYLTGTRN